MTPPRTTHAGRSTLLRLVLALACVVTALGLAPREALAATDPVILKPSPGYAADLGFGGPVKVDFSAAEHGTFHVKVFSSDTTYSWTSDDWDYTGGQTVKSFYFNSINSQGHYKAVVLDSSETWRAVSTFTVAKSLSLTDVLVTPGTFYPLVHDGYRDATRISFRLNQPATLVATVRNEAGAMIRRVDIGRRSQGRHAWTWNGRKNTGAMAAPATYAVEVAAVSDFGRRATVSKSVEVASRYVMRRQTTVRSGIHTSTASRRGNCHITRDSYYSSVTLDCWGGSFAQAYYNFRLPAGASRVTWSVRGVQHCCDEGVIVKRGDHAAPRLFRVLVRVTNWRAFEVRRVSVGYTYKKRI